MRPRRSASGSRPGTWFMNRCDYLDPALAWVGIKDSGRGCALSDEAYTHLTRPKSFHLRKRALSAGSADLRRHDHRHRRRRRPATRMKVKPKS